MNGCCNLADPAAGTLIDFIVNDDGRGDESALLGTRPDDAIETKGNARA